MKYKVKTEGDDVVVRDEYDNIVSMTPLNPVNPSASVARAVIEADLIIHEEFTPKMEE